MYQLITYALGIKSVVREFATLDEAVQHVTTAYKVAFMDADDDAFDVITATGELFAVEPKRN